MWQYETFIHFGYITVDIIGCVDGKYEHNSTKATCRDFAKISLSVGATLVVPPTTTPAPFSLSLSYDTHHAFSLPLLRLISSTLSSRNTCVHVSPSLFISVYFILRTLPPPPIPPLGGGRSPSWCRTPSVPRGPSVPLHLRTVHLFLSLSNVALSDDVISYGALYISQHISVDRLRFGRRSDGKWDFLEIRSPLMVSSVEHEMGNRRRRGEKMGKFDEL